MKISILSIFPEMFEGFLNTSIIKKAILQDFVEVEIVDFRLFTTNKHNRVDEPPYGGGHGLVLLYQPIIDALNSIRQNNSHVVMLGPAGLTLNQNKVKSLAKIEHLVLICGHYEGYDERILNHVNEVVSIGDYILTGGELASMVIADSIIRLIPGVIREESHQLESFENNLLEHAHYTQPREIDGFSVPEVLLSGHHKNIELFRKESSIKKTMKYRPDLLKLAKFQPEDMPLLKKLGFKNCEND